MSGLLNSSGGQEGWPGACRAGGEERGHSPLWKQLKERLVEAEGHGVPGTTVSLRVTTTDPKRTFFTAPQPSCTCPLTLL